MTQMPETEAGFEELLRTGASAARQSAAPGFANRVMSAVRAAEGRRSVASAPITGRWRLAALAAAITLVATLAAAIALLKDSRPTIIATNGLPPATIDTGGPDDAGPGPVAMLASVHRAPQDLGRAVGDAVNREFNLFLDEAWREQQLFLARLPLRGRIDSEAAGVIDAIEAR